MVKKLNSTAAHIEEFVGGLLSEELFLVEVRVSAGRKPKVTVVIDGDEGVTIETCSEISRQTGQFIEEEGLLDSSYILDVSSPGLDAPLSSLRQYRKNIGREVKVKTAGGTLKGELKRVDEDKVLIREKGTRKDPGKEREIPFKEIIETKVQVTFKK